MISHVQVSNLCVRYRFEPKFQEGGSAKFLFAPQEALIKKRPCPIVPNTELANKFVLGYMILTLAAGRIHAT